MTYVPAAASARSTKPRSKVRHPQLERLGRRVRPVRLRGPPGYGMGCGGCTSLPPDQGKHSPDVLGVDASELEVLDHRSAQTGKRCAGIVVSEWTFAKPVRLMPTQYWRFMYERSRERHI
jgi:hypothetical protein